MKIIKFTLLALFTVILTALTVKMIVGLPVEAKRDRAINGEIMPTYTVSDLKKFDGTNQELPVYLGYSGWVYDVSLGRKFYEPGAVYHFLVGKDSTAELNFAGGGIIKSKYKIVGKLVNQP